MKSSRYGSSEKKSFMPRNHVSQLLGLVLLIGLPTIGRLYAQTKTLGVIVNYPGSNPG